uniref:Very-long-chain 3-oxoacyl-CoA synthase n=1 Tax=Angiostrongylus cantonensis TaxID=6313 RepID=A0A158P8F8_ANGCA
MLKEDECYVQFMTNPYLNMGMYVSYYWSTLFVMLYLYYGIYRAAKKLAMKSEQKTKRLALLTELRKPNSSAKTSEANKSSSDSPNDNDTNDSSKCHPFFTHFFSTLSLKGVDSVSILCVWPAIRLRISSDVYQAKRKL